MVPLLNTGWYSAQPQGTTKKFNDFFFGEGGDKNEGPGFNSKKKKKENGRGGIKKGLKGGGYMGRRGLKVEVKKLRGKKGERGAKEVGRREEVESGGVKLERVG